MEERTVPASFQATGSIEEAKAGLTQFVPPDTNGAIGPTHFVETLNNSVSIYTRTGTLVSIVNPVSFFDPDGAGPLAKDGVFDPRVVYDQHTNRFFATVMEDKAPGTSGSTEQNGVFLAVSRTSDPTAAWDKYYMNIGVPNANGEGFFTDYSSLAVDDNGLYIGATIFPSKSAPFSQISVTPKASLVAPTPSLSTITTVTNITDMYSTPQPAFNFDTVSPTGKAYFVASSTTVSADITFRTVTWSNGVPTISAKTSLITTAKYGGFPPQVPNKNGSPVDSIDDRMMNAVIRNGRLWAVRTVGVDSAGGASATTLSAVEWFEIDLAGPNPTVAQTGRIFDPTNGVHYFIPSITVTGQGHARIGFSGANAQQFIGAYYAERLASDAKGTFSKAILFKAGEAGYNQFRWGDYSFTSVDPLDDMTTWTVQQYAESPVDEYGTWVHTIQAPAPTATNPNLFVSKNTTANTVTISGKGFFDPGATFPNRFKGAISGAGFSNVTIQYIDPTTAKLVFDVQGATPVGAYDVTLTNPDGQAVTIPGAITVRVENVPTISDVPDQLIQGEGTTGALQFQVDEVGGNPSLLTVTAKSDNQTLVPDGNITLDGTASVRSVTVAPQPGQIGTVTITLTVTNPVGLSSSETFTVTVNSRPTIDEIPDQFVQRRRDTPLLSFRIADVETPANLLTVTAKSDNQTLLPNANIFLGGAGADRSLIASPAGNLSGLATVFVTVTDLDGGSRTETFTVRVDDFPTISDTPNQLIQQNTTLGPIAITIGDTETTVNLLSLTATSSNTALLPVGNIGFVGTGSPRSLFATPVAGQSGKSTVTLTVTDELGNTATDSFDVVVNATPVISDVPDQFIQQNTNTGALAFTIGDPENVSALVVSATSGNAALVPTGNIVITGTGANRSITVTPVPGQSGVAPITIKVADPDGGAIFENFNVNVNAPPTLSSFSNTLIQRNTSTGAIAFTVGDTETPADKLQIVTTSSNPALIPAPNVVIGGTAADRTLTATPIAGQSGTAVITVQVLDDNGGSATQAFTLVVNAPPVIANLANQLIQQNDFIGPVPFTVTDLETASDQLALTAVSSNTTLVPTSGIVIGGVGKDRTLTITPTPGVAGTTTVSVTAADADGGLTSQSFTFTINALPTISSISTQKLAPGSATPDLSFAVSDAETPISNLVVTARSTNLQLVPISNIVITGNGPTRTVSVQPVANRIGTATITLTVTDANGGLASSNFDVIVSSAPSITFISDRTTIKNTPLAPIPFTISDAETPAGQLTLSVASSNPALFPTGNLVFGGSDGNRTITLTPANNAVGTSTITITVTDGSSLTATSKFDVRVEDVTIPPPLPSGTTLPKQFAVGTDVGGSTVSLFNPDQSIRFTLAPFGNFTSGIRTATADLTNDGVAELLVANGPGQRAQLIVLDGVSQAGLFTATPYESSFLGGAYVTAGDLTGDGIPDIVMTPDQGGGPRVDVFDGKTFQPIFAFLGIDDAAFRGGARATIGDLNGDGRNDLIVVAGFGGGPRVAAYDGISIAARAPRQLFNDFFVFEQSLRNGVFITAGDLNGDGFAELIAGGGPGGGPRVLALDGAALLRNSQVPVVNFFAGDPANRGGVRLAVKDLDNDKLADILTGAGQGSGSRVTGYLGKNVTLSPSPSPDLSFDFDSLSNGVFVG